MPLKQAIKKDPFSTILAKISITFSIGATQMDSIKELINNADKALYQAKNAGKNCIQVYKKLS